MNFMKKRYSYLVVMSFVLMILGILLQSFILKDTLLMANVEALAQSPDVDDSDSSYPDGEPGGGDPNLCMKQGGGDMIRTKFVLQVTVRIKQHKKGNL
jgi:hypothetical protein